MKKTINVWFFVCCMVLMVVAFGVVNANIAANTEEVRLQNSVLGQKLDELKIENQKLNDELKAIGTDTFVERTARDEYDYMMPGELRFVISFPEDESNNDTSL